MSINLVKDKNKDKQFKVAYLIRGKKEQVIFFENIHDAIDCCQSPEYYMKYIGDSNVSKEVLEETFEERNNYVEPDYQYIKLFDTETLELLICYRKPYPNDKCFTTVIDRIKPLFNQQP